MAEGLMVCHKINSMDFKVNVLEIWFNKFSQRIN